MPRPPRRPAAPRYVVDGRRTTTLEAFCAEVARALPGGEACGGPGGADLDALGDVLRGGYGPAPAPFHLVWTHAAVARAALGYPETVRQLAAQLRDCRPGVLIKTAWALRAALRGEGPTVYDRVVARVGAHPNVTLVLWDGAER